MATKPTPSPYIPNLVVADSRVTTELARGTNLSIVTVVGELIREASELRASDIHIDPNLNSVRVRMRIDGVLQEAYTLPKSIHNEVISRIKVLSGLRTDEHQATQDGRFRHFFDNETGACVDVRVSIAPTYHGENTVMRLLSKAQDYSLDTLGYSASDQAKILSAIKKPDGMILSTGPTGSGKTTTLYTVLKMLNKPEVSIVTIEDPIEYAVDDIEQIQVNARTGLTFAQGLRSILRQDPNIIMVGEIRDAETAGIAVNTALTGHLLLSTLHTNDAATTLPRLLDMGIDAYLVASTINIAIGQRLVRRICSDCKEEVPATKLVEETLSSIKLVTPVKKGDIFYRGTGCAACKGSGYKGRVCVNEVLVGDNDIREAILRKASASELRSIAIKNGMTTMLEDGFAKARNGDTTVEEVLRVTHD